ncbi:LuxR C-terminal-related transcriptional regulator [Ramlibacter sp.]|uniref:LuxR C-terminal-related transcriptional regulator n=1 Tax=Ramlibacter sp. TaxID=1917967 RepID=UPI0035B21C2D
METSGVDDLAGFGILLVDDHPLFREGLGLALRQQVPALRVLSVASLEQAAQMLDTSAQSIDLVLIDYRLPGTDGLVGAQQLRRRHPDVAFALMSGADDPGLPQRALAAGLAGYFPKSLEVHHLLQGLRSLAAGEAHFPAATSATTGASPLTGRQQEIVRLAAQGASNKEIAQALGIAPHTVKNHLAQIFEKLGATNRAQAVLMAYVPNASPHERPPP